MMRLGGVLALFLACALPCRALADSPRLYSRAQYSPSCIAHTHDDDVEFSPRLRCTAGIAVKVSSTGMKVRPEHGHLLRARFTVATVFETDSGEGVLDGLVAGDYVCLVYAPRSGIVTARLVIFDPESMPCRPQKRLRRW